MRAALICFFLCCLFAVPGALARSVLALEVAAPQIETFYPVAFDSKHGLVFEISDALRPRLLRQGRVVWTGDPVPAKTNQGFRQAVFSPDGTHILLAAGSVTWLYAVENGAVEADLSGKIYSLFAWAPDSRRVVSRNYLSSAGFVLEIWDVLSGVKQAMLPLPKFERATAQFKFRFDQETRWTPEELVWSPDAQTIYVALRASPELQPLPYQMQDRHVSWTQLAALDTAGAVRWQIPLSGPDTRLYAGTFSSFSVSSDGARLQCGNGQTRLVNARDGTVLQTDLSFRFQTAGFSGDGRLLFVASSNEARLYRARDGRFLGTHTLPAVSSSQATIQGQRLELDQHGGFLLTPHGKVSLARMWKRGYDWDSQGERLRRLDGFSGIAWSARGRAATFDSGVVCLWNDSMTRIEAISPHPILRVSAVQLEDKPGALWVWGEIFAEMEPTSDGFNHPYFAAWKLDIKSGKSQIMWRKPVNRAGYSKAALSPDLRVGAITRAVTSQSLPIGVSYEKDDPTQFPVDVFDARSGEVTATVGLPWGAAPVAVSDLLPGGRLLLVNRSQAHESRLFVLAAQPRQKWSAQISDNWFFIPGSPDLFGRAGRYDTRLEQLQGFPNLWMLAYTRRGIWAELRAPQSGTLLKSLIVDRNAHPLLILPVDWQKEKMRERLLDFAPDGAAVTQRYNEHILSFWRVQKSRPSS